MQLFAGFARIAQLKRSLAELVSATSIALLQTKQRLSVIGIFDKTLSSCDRLIMESQRKEHRQKYQ